MIPRFHRAVERPHGSFRQNADIAVFAGRAAGGAGHRVGQVVERDYALTLSHTSR
jgi:hypothetical protein